MLLWLLQCTGQSLHQRMVQSKMPAVPRLRSPSLEVYLLCLQFELPLSHFNTSYWLSTFPLLFRYNTLSTVVRSFHLHFSICSLLAWGTVWNNAEILILQVSVSVVCEGLQSIQGQMQLMGDLCTSSPLLDTTKFLTPIYSHRLM